MSFRNSFLEKKRGMEKQFFLLEAVKAKMIVNRHKRYDVVLQT